MYVYSCTPSETLMLNRGTNFLLVLSKFSFLFPHYNQSINQPYSKAQNSTGGESHCEIHVGETLPSQYVQKWILSLINTFIVLI